jgi:hypothetical protein
MSKESGKCRNLGVVQSVQEKLRTNEQRTSVVESFLDPEAPLDSADQMNMEDARSKQRRTAYSSNNTSS